MYIYQVWNGIVSEKNVADYILLQGDLSFWWSACGPLIVDKKVLQIKRSHPLPRKAQKDASQKIINGYNDRDFCNERREYESRSIELEGIWEKAEADATAYLEARDKVERDLSESK